jgi:hypothetical protein
MISEKFPSKAGMPKLKEGISEEETFEQRQIYRMASLLEIAEKAADEKYTITDEIVKKLQENIEEVRSKGIDLSEIKNFDERINKLTGEAPMISVEGSLNKMRETKADEKIGEHEKKLALASWYWHIKEKLDKHKDKIEDENKERIETELGKTAKELGIE